MTDTRSKLVTEFLKFGATKDAAEKSADFVLAHASEILHPMTVASIIVDKGVLKIVGSGFGTKGKHVASLGSGSDVVEPVVKTWSDTTIEAQAYIGASKDDTVEVRSEHGTVVGVIGN